MTNFAYTDNIPASQNNPSVDQPKMKVNTKSIKDLIFEDHITFGVANGGFHKKSRYVNTVGIPIGLQAGIGTAYTKLATSTGASQESNLFYIPDTGDPAPGPTRDYQITRTITGSYARFATGLQYQASSGSTPALFGGWTFLPGGLLMQYGQVAHTTNQETTITFPVPFSSTPFSIQASGIIGAFDPNTRAAIGIRSVSSTSFVARTTTNNELTGIYWMAIGK